MIPLNILYYDFDNKKDRLLKLRMDSDCYDVQLNYIPQLEETDYFNEIENLDKTIQFLLLSNPDFDGTLILFFNLVKLNKKGKCQTQTLMISISHAFPKSLNNYIDILPERIDEQHSHKNINGFTYPIKSFDDLYPQK